MGPSLPFTPGGPSPPGIPGAPAIPGKPLNPGKPLGPCIKIKNNNNLSLIKQRSYDLESFLTLLTAK